MARRPFDPVSRGWTKTEYHRGDILDRGSVDALVADADVVVHLAYLIMGSRAQSHRVNLEGSRNVFEAAAAAHRPVRLVYTSSVAAYGYYSDNPVPLTEDVPHGVRRSTTTPSRRQSAKRCCGRQPTGRGWRCMSCAHASSPGPRRPH